MDDKTIFSASLSAKGINFVGQLFQNNQQIKLKFLIVQITHALPISWKEILRNYTENINNLVFQDHHLIKNIKYCP